MKSSIGRGLGRTGNIAIVLVFVLLAVFIGATTHYGTRALSAIRAYVGAESQWTKAQKQAVVNLLRYSVEQDPELYEQVHADLELHAAFRDARQTLRSGDPDYELAVRGFQAADLHRGDIELLVWLTEHGTNLPYVGRYISRSLDIWREGDRLIHELRDRAAGIREAVKAGRMEGDVRRQAIREIAAVDAELTELETEFSLTMAEGARVGRRALVGLVVGTGVILVLAGYVITGTLFRRVNQLNQALSDSESRFSRVLAHSRDIAYELNIRSGTYEYISPAAETGLGYSPERMMAGGSRFVLDLMHPDDRALFEQELQRLRQTDADEAFRPEVEFRVLSSEGRYVWVNNRRTLMRDDSGAPVAIIGTVRDISASRQHQEQLQKSLDEKKTLLAEVHHRVKNNLTVISSLLALQKSQSTGDSFYVLKDTESRIQSISMIHEKLYQTHTFSDVDMRDYIDDFVTMVAHSFGANEKKVSIERAIERIRLDITRAVPLGLILNELVTNAFKHGLSSVDNGVLRVELGRRHENVILRVTNNGIPLPEDFSLESVHSLGMRLIHSLTDQLRGTVGMTRNGATTFTITFPVGEQAE